MTKTTSAPSHYVRNSLYGVLCILVLGVAWILTHALADDARPALGTVHTAAGTPTVTYYLLEPKSNAEKTETVVLLASLGRPVSDFNELATSLVDAGYRTIAVESRGIMTWSGGGLSRYELGGLAGDIRLAVSDAGVAPNERIHLIGHAFGNRVVRTFATLYPKQTAGLVLVAAGDKTDTMPADVARSLRLSTLGFVPWSVRGASVSKVFFAAGAEAPEYWKRGWSSWGAIGQVRAAKSDSNGNFNAGGSGPMLVLQAQDDLIAPPKDAGELLKANYGARVTLVPVSHAGHALLPEQPGVISSAVVAFLREHPAR
ncbi:alpha/beta fold hydrolase [Roseateles koreensis]|uniref:Alpha/beta hydrolase n=1 Tax=Roseateles koreensis TaxID=2987526 RepID=A0ABT5KRW5_9BURK|nr:alpha/beta hydrolase [Roseateles koreensis]MDC8784522.1 alpha/beta hydrolase [Roseateles koreensis]